MTLISDEQIEREFVFRTARERDLRYLLAIKPPPDWVAGGALCLQVGPYLWESEALADRRQAKAVCATCPMQQACLDYSLDPQNAVTWGVWGGVDQYERQKGITEPVPPSEEDESPQSVVPGVSWNKQRGKWRVKITQDEVSHHGGSFDDQDEAEQAAEELRERLERGE